MKENDQKAQAIGQNGKDLFYALYSDQQKIKFDAILALRKYQSMMNFVPESPDK